MSQEKGPNAVENSARGYGLTFIFWILEHPYCAVGLGLAIPLAIIYGSLFPVGFFNGLLLLLSPFIGLVLLVAAWFVKSQFNNEGGKKPSQALLKWIDLKESSLKGYFPRAKLPMETFIEEYIRENVDIKEDLYEILLHRYELFKFNFTGGHVKGFINDVIKKAIGHDHEADLEDVAGVYNRGNDFYNWFLGHHMLYSTAIFRDREEPLYDAQERKLHTICKMSHMKPGMEHLDLGCGWGTLIAHAAKHYKVNSTGITLSKEQAAFGRQRIKDYGVEGNAKINVINVWDIDTSKKYDRITCLEMSEHIGIRYYQKFMHHIRGILKDDGIFYLQIAGLRRTWQYEDLAWGLFMGKYIFPGADASCPLGWVCNQVERGGFEVHRVENTGVHYALTIYAWYKEWVRNKDKVVAKYKERWWRLWAVFLAWSAIIAAQGTSTVFLITLMKNTKCDKTSMKTSAEWSEPQPVLDRTAFKVGPEENVIGVQC